jgi:hypothetical protein
LSGRCVQILAVRAIWVRPADLVKANRAAMLPLPPAP